MRLPQPFVHELWKQLEPYAAGRGHRPLLEAHQMLGKAGRVAYVIAETRPFVSALWAPFRPLEQQEDSRAGAKHLRVSVLAGALQARQLGYERCWRPKKLSSR